MVFPSVVALGYLEFGVSDLGAWTEYAQQVLGVFCIATEQDLQLRFDAHAWRIRLTPTGEDDIRCAGLEVASAADLLAIRARLEAQGVEVYEAGPEHAASRRADNLLLCRDPIGLQIELFVGARTLPEQFESPIGVGGFDVEYGYGGVEIDDATWRPETYFAPSLWGHRGSLN
ncbi:MAG: hypothetical protein KF911_01680 [Pseudomonadales bacterium]|nr:hypothetical protein [Pseudomonadales bacterium]